ncbi:MAG: hypothetical protein ABIJ08_07210 [Nanoarchaeota archaeon]
MTKQYSIVHAIPNGFRPELTDSAIYDVLYRGASVINNGARKVHPTVFANVDENLEVHVLGTGKKGLTFHDVSESLTYLKRNFGLDVGYVLGCYVVKSGLLSGMRKGNKPTVANLEYIHNISGGVIPREKHAELYLLFEKFNEACNEFTGSFARLKTIDSAHLVRQSIGTSYFEQQWMQNFTGRANQIKRKIEGQDYRARRFYEVDPISQMEDLLNLLAGFWTKSLDRQGLRRSFDKLEQVWVGLDGMEDLLHSAFSGLEVGRKDLVGSRTLTNGQIGSEIYFTKVAEDIVKAILKSLA